MRKHALAMKSKHLIHEPFMIPIESVSFPTDRPLQRYSLTSSLGPTARRMYVNNQEHLAKFAELDRKLTYERRLKEKYKKALQMNKMGYRQENPIDQKIQKKTKKVKTMRPQTIAISKLNKTTQTDKKYVAAMQTNKVENNDNANKCLEFRERAKARIDVYNRHRNGRTIDEQMKKSQNECKFFQYLCHQNGKKLNGVSKAFAAQSRCISELRSQHALYRQKVDEKWTNIQQIIGEAKEKQNKRGLSAEWTQQIMTKMNGQIEAIIDDSKGDKKCVDSINYHQHSLSDLDLQIDQEETVLIADSDMSSLDQNDVNFLNELNVILTK